MSKDFYAVLGVSRTANVDELKKAYRALAMKWHPDRNPNNVAEANERFQSINEAFETLSDDSKRARYDMKTGQRPQANRYHDFGFPSSSFTNSSFFNDTFRAFSGFSARRRYRQTPPSNPYPNGRSTWNTTPESNPKPQRKRHYPFNDTPSATSKDPQLVVSSKLGLTLEEIYTGTTKRRKVIRKSREGIMTEKILDIDIKPGCKSGTKILFPGEGDELADGKLQDIEFIVEETPHPNWAREGDSLHVTVNLTLVEALTGFSKEIAALDETLIPLKSNTTIQPGQRVRMNRRGMPNIDTGRKGDLVVTYNVTLPTNLSDAQKQIISDTVG